MLRQISDELSTLYFTYRLCAYHVRARIVCMEVGLDVVVLVCKVCVVALSSCDGSV